MVGSEKLETASYAPPDTLPHPENVATQLPLMAILAGIMAAGLLGVVLFFAAQLVYVYFLYNALLGMGIGRTIALAPRESHYTGAGLLFSATALCCLLSYVVFNVALYFSMLGDMPAEFQQLPFVTGFLAFVLARASLEPFLFGIEPGVIGNSVIWVAEFGITLYFAWTQVDLARQVSRIEAVPAEVTELEAHLLSQGQDFEQIRLALAQRGWSQREDQDRALKAVKAVAVLAEAEAAAEAEGEDRDHAKAA